MGVKVEIKYKNRATEKLYDGLARDFIEQHRINDYLQNEFIYFSYDDVNMCIKQDEIISVKVIDE